MFNINYLTQLIEKIPQIFIYIVPGIIFLVIWGFICNKKPQGDNRFLVYSVVWSFIIVTVTKIIFPQGKYFTLATIFSSVIFSVVLSIFYKSNLFQVILARLRINKTTRDSMWDEIMDEYDVFIKLYVAKDEVIYYGLYKSKEDKDENIYVLITDYDVKDYKGTTLYDYTNDRTCWAMINTKDITRVEIFYDKNSDKSKKIIGKKYFNTRGVT